MRCLPSSGTWGIRTCSETGPPCGTFHGLVLTRSSCARQWQARRLSPRCFSSSGSKWAPSAHVWSSVLTCGRESGSCTVFRPHSAVDAAAKILLRPVAASIPCRAWAAAFVLEYPVVPGCPPHRAFHPLPPPLSLPLPRFSLGRLGLPTGAATPNKTDRCKRRRCCSAWPFSYSSLRSVMSVASLLPPSRSKRRKRPSKGRQGHELAGSEAFIS